MDKYFVSMQGEIPKYITITRHIKRLIDINKIEDGEKLPSIRSLSEFLNVNNVTIVNAYKRLQNEGYAVQKMGSGTYAKKKDITKNFKKEYSEALKKISGKMVKEYVDFTGETPSNDFFPVQSFKDVLNEVLDRDGAEALIYQEALGYEGLRKSISEVFWNKKIKSDDILIVSGAQQGIDIVSKALINTNDNVIVEKPTYSGALSVFKWRRANIYEVPIGKDGIDVDKFEKILKKNNIKCFYTMSYFQNPTGMSYSIEKKQQILNLAEIYDFYIIEDDYLAELIYDHSIKYKSFKSLDKNDRVIYIKSFSKIFLPGIRIGYLIPPMKFKESIENSKINTDISTSSLMQRALDLYIKKGLWKDYMNNLNHIYKNRYLLMEECIKSHLENKVDFISPGGGLNFYLKIKDSIYVDSIELFRKTKDKKVLITPGTLFYKSPSEGKKYFRISFSQTDEEAMQKGLSIINELLE
ncbi:GntR family transcriptional regulator [Clostridium carboxidivorans P7]|uniref:Transcriptional regulator, GntR family with aminotransferase domain n=1 Tax=Clostridium carboxidivorans P7 TaxID=536227 RepID=C6PXP1_9CLOT|nr:PLP-dependent aminotransferase family protein [Clostridium carboxidivorans]AKN32490.1 GntR family transcriptional regulator [Clostridium carboxidivorans P7]EET85968.1 transcriptional regulator, GntR family with aminotransferase domain [Clostridium carboxidivorans P7]EFG87629.1 transcriptional regulator, GntR family [Clostridium carboxidivorans P7]